MIKNKILPEVDSPSEECEFGLYWNAHLQAAIITRMNADQVSLRGKRGERADKNSNQSVHARIVAVAKKYAETMVNVMNVYAPLSSGSRSFLCPFLFLIISDCFLSGTIIRIVLDIVK